jgi:hypothetical protein
MGASDPAAGEQAALRSVRFGSWAFLVASTFLVAGAGFLVFDNPLGHLLERVGRNHFAVDHAQKQILNRAVAQPLDDAADRVGRQVRWATVGE